MVRAGGVLNYQAHMTPEPTSTPEELLAAAIADPGKREGFLRSITPRVHSMVEIRLAPTPAQLHEVDDLTQQVLLAVSEGLNGLRNQTPDGVRMYMSRIVTNKVADFLRSANTVDGARRASLESSVRNLASAGMLRDLLPASGLSACTSASQAELIELVTAELGRLNERYREVIALAFFDQLTIGQIAERLEMTRPAASMLLIRSVNALRQRVSESTSTDIPNVERA